MGSTYYLYQPKPPFILLRMSLSLASTVVTQHAGCWTGSSPVQMTTTTLDFVFPLLFRTLSTQYLDKFLNFEKEELHGFQFQIFNFLFLDFSSGIGTSGVGGDSGGTVYGHGTSIGYDWQWPAACACYLTSTSSLCLSMKSRD